MSTIILNPQIFGGTNSNVPIPAPGELTLGFDQDNLLKFKDSDGVTHLVGSTGSGGPSTDQDNIINVIPYSLFIGGRSMSLSVETQVNNKLQNIFDTETIVVEDIENILFDVFITDYNAGFQTHNRKFLLVGKGKGTYSTGTFNALQVDTDISLISVNGGVTTTPADLVMDVNNVIFDLGDITGSEYIDYINNNGDTYNLSDTSKIYYFKFIQDSVEYVYYFEGVDSVNGYGIYGLGELQLQTTPNPDLVLFYDESLPQVTTPSVQDNRFRFVDFNITLKSKDLNITLENTISLLRDRVNSLFSNSTLQILDTELIIFQFYIKDLRNGTKYIWRYFNKHMLGKGIYSPISSTITFDNLKLANADNIIEFITPSDINSNPNNVVFNLGDITTPLNSYTLLEYLNSYTPPFDMSDDSKIYYFQFIDTSVEYIYFYSTEAYGIFGLSNNQFVDGDLILFYDSTLYTPEIISPIDNIPLVYDLNSSILNKDFRDITDIDVKNYINGLTGSGLFISDVNSVVVVNVYQPKIDIHFNNITSIGINKLDSVYEWNDWFGNHNYALDVNNKDFGFSEVMVSGNTISLVGDLNNISTFNINTFDINNISFEYSKIESVYLNSTNYLVDMSNLSTIENIGLTGASTSNIPIGGKVIKNLRVSGNSVLGVSIVTQGTYSVPSNYYIASPITSLSFQNILSKLVMSPTGNTGSFGMTALSTYTSGNTYSAAYVSILTTRGWNFYSL